MLELAEICERRELSYNDIGFITSRIARGEVLMGISPGEMRTAEEYHLEFEAQANKLCQDRSGKYLSH